MSEYLKVHNISNIDDKAAKMSYTAISERKGKITRRKENCNSGDFWAVLVDVEKTRRKEVKTNDN